VRYGFNVGAALRLPKVVSRRAERRLEEIELFRLLTAVEKKPRDRAIIEALYGTGARVDELVQLKRQQLVADIDGPGGYVTLYGKHGGRTIRLGGRTWDALQFLADGKEPDERIIAITDERIRQIFTAAAAAAGLKKKLSPQGSNNPIHRFCHETLWISFRCSVNAINQSSRRSRSERPRSSSTWSAAGHKTLKMRLLLRRPNLHRKLRSAASRASACTKA
jgi:integrase